MSAAQAQLARLDSELSLDRIRADGATLPPDTPLRERYAYQFYVKPLDDDLKKLLLELTPEARTNWAEFIDGKSRTVNRLTVRSISCRMRAYAYMPRILVTVPTRWMATM